MSARATRGVRLALVTLSALLLAACSAASTASPSTSTPVTASPAGSGAPVAVTLKEFSITVSGQASPGNVSFQVTNKGTMIHEFDIYKSQLPLDKLPINGSQQVDEGNPAVDTIEASEPIAAGATVNIVARLAAGHYYIVCNQPGHYSLGMRLDLVVG